MKIAIALTCQLRFLSLKVGTFESWIFFWLGKMNPKMWLAEMEGKRDERLFKRDSMRKY